MLTKLVHQHLNKRLAEKRVEIEELIENYDKIILNSNKKLKKYYNKKRDILHEQIKYLRKETKQYTKVIDTIIHITNLVGNQYLEVIDCLVDCYNEKLRQQLLYNHKMVLRASRTLINDEVKQINELTVLYKSQSDYHMRIHCLNNLTEFKKLNIGTYKALEAHVTKSTYGSYGLIDSFEKKSYKKVLVRLKNDQNFQKLKELDQRKKRLKDQNKKFYSEQILCANSLESQKQITQRLNADYIIKGRKYYTLFNAYNVFNTNTSELFEDLNDRISSLEKLMIGIKMKRSNLEEKRKYLKEKKDQVHQEKTPLEDKKNILRKLKDDCYKYHDYSKLDYYKKEIIRNNEEIKNIKSELSRSFKKIQEIREFEHELDGQYKNYNAQFHELKREKRHLLNLLKNGLRDFHPSNIDHLFSETLKPEINNIEDFKAPKMKKLKHC